MGPDPHPGMLVRPESGPSEDKSQALVRMRIRPSEDESQALVRRESGPSEDTVRPTEDRDRSQ